MQNNPQTNPAGQQPVAPGQGQGRGGRGQIATPPVPPEFQADKYLKMNEAELLQFIQDPNATVFQKNIACRRLAIIGTRSAVAPLAALLSDEQVAHYARFALRPNPDPSVDEALRAAIPKLKGKLLVGVIDTIGGRGDMTAVDALTRLMYGGDPEVAAAAASALGRIGGPRGAKALQDALAKTNGELRTEVGNAVLIAAEGFMDKGDRKQALALYNVLSRPDMPKHVRLGAMHSTLIAETMFTRPRETPAKQ